METRVDRFGRVLIPKEVRDELGLEAGTVLRVERGDRELRLSPVSGEPLSHEDGVLVYSGTADGELAGAVAAHRRGRIAQVSRRNRKRT